MMKLKSKEEKALKVVEKVAIPKKVIAAAKVEVIPEPKKKILKDSKNTTFNILDAKKSWTDITYWRNMFWRKVIPQKIFLINMELRNGYHHFFTTVTNDASFVYQKGRYVIDDSLKYQDLATGLYCLDYHQDLDIPLKRKVPLDDIKKTILATGVIEVETAVNPSLLEEYVNTKLIEQAMKGRQMDEVFKFMKIMLIANLIVASIHLMIFVSKSGMLNSVKIPGFG